MLLNGERPASTGEAPVYHRHRRMRFSEGSRNQILKSNAVKPDAKSLVLGHRLHSVRGSVLALPVGT